MNENDAKLTTLKDVALHVLTERLVKMLYEQHGMDGLSMLLANLMYEIAEIDVEAARAGLKYTREMVNSMVADGVAVEAVERGKMN
jgi:hypothetical protein